MKNCYKTGSKKWLLLAAVMISAQMVLAQTPQEVSRITKDYNKVEMLRQAEEHKQKSTQEKERAVRIAREKGWEIIRTMPDGTYMELQRVTEDGHPIYYTTFNVNAAKSTRTNFLHSGGLLGLNLNGQNMIAHVWDGGLARATHQEYDGAGGTNRFTVGDGTTTTHYHAAHVTGTIIASGVQAAAKGMAPHARAIGYEWNNDLSEATTAAANGMLISNHSYGYRADMIPKWWFGAYIDVSRDWDNLMSNSPYYLMVVAAGNDGTSTQNTSPLAPGYDKLSGHATAKNNLVVANAQDASITSAGELSSVSINSSSSQGPTDDLRIKPDITGNGTSVYSTYDNSDNAYNSITGTSMASPNVAGTILLLQQHNNNTNGAYLRAATLKGLVMHTADDAGPAGPDAVWGWGLLNAKKAAETITSNGTSSIVEERTLTSGQSYSFTVTAAGGGVPLFASVSWTDLPGVANTGTTNDATPVLVNDLDIRVTQSSTTHLPWKLTSATANARGDNNVDPYERVDVANASGTYTITVTHKGTLSGGSQPYSIIVTGITNSVCNAIVPGGLAVSNIASSTATVNWTAVAGATYDVQYRVNGTSTWTTVAAASNGLNLTDLAASTTYNVQVRSKCPNGTASAYSTAVNFTTSSVEIAYCASKGNTTADEWIGRVQLNTINNASGAGGGYQDFTSISTSLEKGVAYTITITPAWAGTVYAEGYSVWIDYNNDGTFQTDEQVFSKSASKTAPVSGSFTVPTSALNGETRMRVSMKYNGIPTACETFSYGEVEDYTIDLMDAAPVCNVPSGLNATSITQTTATLNWSSATGANSYEARIRAIGTTTWTTLSASGASLNVSGLQSATQYEFQVRSICTGQSGLYSASASFTTLSTSLTYCASKGNNSSYEWIRRVKLNEVDNESGNNNGYGNFTNMVATVQRGASVTMNVQAAFSGTAYTEYWSVWIDLNQDGTFSSDELLVNGSSSSSNLLSATLNIPSTALTGQTRMRVSMKYNAAPTACETFAYGEVEDYTVNIVNSLNSNMAEAGELADALGDELAPNGIMLFPIPASTELNVNIRGLDTSKPIRIYNVSGVMVREVYTGSEMNKIDVQTLAAGVYFLKAYNDREEVIETFIIK